MARTLGRENKRLKRLSSQAEKFQSLNFFQLFEKTDDQERSLG